MSRRKPRHPTTRRVVILLLWIGLIAFGLAPVAYSDESPGAGYELPARGKGPEGVVGLSTGTLAKRSKLLIKLSNALAWIIVKPPRDPNYPLPRGKLWPLPDEIQSRVPGCVVTGMPIIADMYAIGPKAEGQPVGVFPPTTVRAAAFGSIPVTVTLELSQIIGGELRGFEADLWQIGGGLSACDPDFGAQSPVAYGWVRGQLSLKISRATIDGQPVDVGPDCHAVDPLKINLWGDRAGETVRPPDAGPDWTPGWLAASGGLLYQRKDTAREPVPGGYLLHPGSTDLTIPPFAGCRGASGEDVSRLLTATISGPGNQLALRQPGLGFNVPRSEPTRCYPNENDPSRPPIECPLDPPAPPDIPVPTD
jgi:hypothetical protein